MLLVEIICSVGVIGAWAYIGIITWLKYKELKSYGHFTREVERHFVKGMWISYIFMYIILVLCEIGLLYDAMKG